MRVPCNDKGTYLNFTILDSNGDAYTLTGYTITLKSWRAGTPGTIVTTGDCPIVAAASGTCRYLITSASFVAVETLSAELELTKEGVIESTIPFTIEVTESG